MLNKATVVLDHSNLKQQIIQINIDILLISIRLICGLTWFYNSSEFVFS